MAGEAVQVEVAVAVQGFQNPVALKKEPDVKIIGHSDPAVHLDRFACCKLRSLAQLGLGQAREFGYVIRLVIQSLQCFEHQGFAHFDFTEQVCGPVLKGLEGTD